MNYSTEDRYYTINKIPKHRLEYISKRVKEFIKEFNITTWPLGFFQILLQIQNNQSIPIYVETITTLSDKTYAATVYSEKYKKFIIVINKDRLQDQFTTLNHNNLNFILAHEMGHIYLRHYELPDDCKNEDDLRLEELEADEFAYRLLISEKNYR